METLNIVYWDQDCVQEFYVVVDCNTRENFGDYGYDRTYTLVKCRDINKSPIKKLSFTNNDFITQVVRGVELPFKAVENAEYQLVRSVKDKNGEKFTYKLKGGKVKTHTHKISDKLDCAGGEYYIDNLILDRSTAEELFGEDLEKFTGRVVEIKASIIETKFKVEGDK